jgi:uncharacterized membrane protein YdfJ with MMPL/SSD domain
MSTQKTRYSDHFTEWDQLQTAVAANAADLPQTEVARAGLQRVQEEVRQILREQSAFQASKQQSSKRLRKLITDGAKLATVLRVITKQHYGHESEKLVEFGVQPLRRRTRPQPPAIDPPKPPAPSGE